MFVRDACDDHAPSCHDNMLLQKPGKTSKITKFLENHENPPNRSMCGGMLEVPRCHKCQKVLALANVPALNELDLGAQKELKGVLGL